MQNEKIEKIAQEKIEKVKDKAETMSELARRTSLLWEHIYL